MKEEKVRRKAKKDFEIGVKAMDYNAIDVLWLQKSAYKKKG